MEKHPPNRVSEPAANSLKPAMAVAFTVVAWASAFPLLRVALAEMSPAPLAAARFAAAALPITGWLLWRRPSFPSPRHAMRFCLCGLFGIALAHVSLNTGQRTVTAGAASFIASTIPVFTALLAQLLLRERLSPMGWTGTAVSIAGVAMIASGQPGGLAFGGGSTFVLGTAIFTALYFIVQRPLVAIYGALPCAAYTLLVGACLLAPWLPVAATELFDASSKTVICVLVLGLVPSALGYATWTFALGHFGAARASNFLYLMPPAAMFLAFVLTREVPRLATLAGGMVSILGVVVVNWRKQVPPAR